MSICLGTLCFFTILLGPTCQLGPSVKPSLTSRCGTGWERCIANSPVPAAINCALLKNARVQGSICTCRYGGPATRQRPEHIVSNNRFGVEIIIWPFIAFYSRGNIHLIALQQVQHRYYASTEVAGSTSNWSKQTPDPFHHSTTLTLYIFSSDSQWALESERKSTPSTHIPPSQLKVSYDTQS